MTIVSTYSPRRRRRFIALIGVVVVTILAVTFRTVLLRTQLHPSCSVASSSGDTYRLDPEQAQNASIIAAEGHRLGVADHGVTVAIAAALQETNLRNLSYGDRDSRGLFQQRPSQGWGTPAELMDPAFAATAFYRKLFTVPGWGSMAVSDAAQRVQRSANPQAYAEWEPRARALARALTGEVAGGLACRFRTFDSSPPAAGALTQAASAQFGSAVLGVPVGTKLGWAVAAWSVAHAYRYHVASVTYAGRRWVASRGTWTNVPSVSDNVMITG